mmetsp:Transcript_16788/g.21240  ORF Transcript_16788/g.21240 Transcript_16788/m.21240 type:complete len:239 (-) Transcript_16788:552-1268(-)
MRVSQDPLHLLVILVLLLELVSVGELLFLAREERLDLLGGITLPDAQVGVLAARHHILSIVRVQDGVDLLHALRVVDLARAPIVVGENADRLVEGGRHELLARRREVHIQHRRQVVLVDHLWLIELSHIEGVAVGIFITDDDIHGLLRVPAEGGRLILQVDFLQSRLASQVVENDAAVVADGSDERGLTRIKLQLRDGVGLPRLEALYGRGALIAPDLDDGAGRSEQVLAVRRVAAKQ